MLRFGILGFGHHAEKRLMPGFARAVRSRPVAFWRNNQALVSETEKRYALRAHATPEELCADPEVDAVFIASPDAFHLEHALMAFAHGKPVLCEKPVAMNAFECERMLQASRASGVQLGVAHVMRFHQSVNLARQWVRKKRLGRILHAHAEFTYPGLHSPRTWITDAKLATGGPTADVGVHCFDTLRYVLGTEVSAVSCRMSSDAASGSVEASSAAILELRGDCTADVFVTTRAPYRTYLEIVGTERALESRNAFWVDGSVDLVLLEDSREVERVTCDNSEAYALQTDAFADLVLEGRPFPCTGEDGLANQRIIDSCYESARTGARVVLAEK